MINLHFVNLWTKPAPIWPAVPSGQPTSSRWPSLSRGMITKCCWRWKRSRTVFVLQSAASFNQRISCRSRSLRPTETCLVIFWCWTTPWKARRLAVLRHCLLQLSSWNLCWARLTRGSTKYPQSMILCVDLEIRRTGNGILAWRRGPSSWLPLLFLVYWVDLWSS